MKYAFYKTRLAHNSMEVFLAWGGLKPLEMDCPVKEPQDPIYFCYGDTEDKAVEMLEDEITKHHGPIRMWKL